MNDTCRSVCQTSTSCRYDEYDCVRMQSLCIIVPDEHFWTNSLKLSITLLTGELGDVLYDVSLDLY